MNRIRVEIDVPSVGTQIHEYEYCPVPNKHCVCPIMQIECRFGLTEIDVPIGCPMSFGTMKMSFDRVRHDIEK